MKLIDLNNDIFPLVLDDLYKIINGRKISKDLIEFVLDTLSRAITSHVRPGIDLPDHIFNELRISLPCRVYKKDKQINSYYGIFPKTWQLAREWPPPNLIEKIHPPKYYHNAKKLSAPSRFHTNP